METREGLISWERLKDAACRAAGHLKNMGHALRDANPVTDSEDGKEMMKFAPSHLNYILRRLYRQDINVCVCVCVCVCPGMREDSEEKRKEGKEEDIWES
ncbi:hypothetical protein E2C01_087824 [Portunus trituberculatus]|uniref:Uncharacterized protein n=1 Tax=Portunus trituberculatus TaxID=210409 RepID=A0A5B7JIA8_PORTR|nr:hypothetical protein [Portunus trituberculatus]